MLNLVIELCEYSKKERRFFTENGYIAIWGTFILRLPLKRFATLFEVESYNKFDTFQISISFVSSFLQFLLLKASVLTRFFV